MKDSQRKAIHAKKVGKLVQQRDALEKENKLGYRTPTEKYNKNRIEIRKLKREEDAEETFHKKFGYYAQ